MILEVVREFANAVLQSIVICLYNTDLPVVIGHSLIPSTASELLEATSSSIDHEVPTLPRRSCIAIM